MIQCVDLSSRWVNAPDFASNATSRVLSCKITSAVKASGKGTTVTTHNIARVRIQRNRFVS